MGILSGSAQRKEALADLDWLEAMFIENARIADMERGGVNAEQAIKRAKSIIDRVRAPLEDAQNKRTFEPIRGIRE